MKKSNFIVLGILALISVFLLWLWWYLGFARSDGPADALITVGWWIIIGLMGYGIYRMELRRREQMRTVYVSPTALFNCESGLIECGNIAQRVDLVEEIVKSMHYGMDFQDMPDVNDFGCSYIIHTQEYKDSNDWRGTVVKVDRGGTSFEKSFDSRTALMSALAG